MSSNHEQQRIVITGMGMISPIGNGRSNFHAAIQAGKSGIQALDSEIRHVAFHGIGGQVTDFDEKTVKKEFFKEKEQKKSVKVMCREVQMGAASALLALEDSGLDLDAIDHSRMGVDFGANLMFYPPETLAEACRAASDGTGQFDAQEWGGAGLNAMEPLWMLKYLPNMPACHVGIFTDARGPNNSVTLDDASTGVALTEALNILQRDAADIMIVGGTGTQLHAMRTLHARLWHELGHDDTNPSASCKPFDVNRNGRVVAECGGALILEQEDHAKARGATIYGVLLGGASSCVGRPDGTFDTTQAVYNALNAALLRSDRRPEDLGHINAHGLGSQEDDANEAAAYRNLLGDADVPVTGLKGYFGNGGAGSGFLEIAGSLLSLRDGTIPYTLHCQNPDPQLGINVVVNEPLATSNRLFSNVNYTRAGQASAVVIEALGS